MNNLQKSRYVYLMSKYVDKGESASFFAWRPFIRRIDKVYRKVIYEEIKDFEKKYKK